MASVKFVRKVPAGALGNFNYEYECTCAKGAKHKLTFTTTNDIQAKQLAEQECTEKCGE